MSDLVDVRPVPGKGRGIFAKVDLKAGSTVLSERPVLLSVDHRAQGSVCSLCLRLLPGGLTVAPDGGQGVFCSEGCRHTAGTQPGAPSPALEQLLHSAPADALADDERNQLRYLLQCLSLQRAAGGCEDARRRWEALHGLALGRAIDPAQIARVHAVACQVTGNALSLDAVAELLGKEACNSYAVMAPSDAEGERRVRGSGIYPFAACLNHECLPNAARVDNFDADGDARTSIEIRMLHDLPAGEEVVISYFPLNWSLFERQERCQRDYGFVCLCPRCKCEQVWSFEKQLGEEEGPETLAARAAMAQAQQTSASHAEAADPTYLQLFLLKYLCSADDCFGTVVPIAVGSTTHACNLCGAVRTEEEFMSDLNAQMESG